MSSQHQAFEENQEEISDEQDNENLLDDIDELGNRTDYIKQNVLLCGKVGSGKSSLINALGKAFSGKYTNKATCGKGVSFSKTLAFERFECCGVKEDDITENRRKVKDILSKLPNFFDFPGLEDTEDETLQEILELVTGGFIPPRTSLEALIKMQEEHGVGCLKKSIYTKSREEWKITAILFVQSCREPAPVNLISCLKKVTRKFDHNSAQLLYTGKIHVVMTKYDLVKKQHEYDSADNETISEGDYREIEDEVANLFSIDGNRNDNLTRVTSYSDRINPEMDNPAIDNVLLKLIKHIMTPRNVMVTDRITVMTVMTKIDLAVRKWLRNLNFNSAQILFLALVLMLAIILFWFLSRPITVRPR